MNSTKTPIVIFWFRRDLRLEDNVALYRALNSGFLVLPIFIFDTEILDNLENKKDARVLFIHQEITKLKRELEKLGSSLLVFNSTPKKSYLEILQKFDVKAVFANRDYEPYAQKRDKEIYLFLKEKGIEFIGSKDHVIFEKDEIVKDDKKPYTIFTPYSRKWKNNLNEFCLEPYSTEKYFNNFYKCQPFNLPSLADIGFEEFQFNFPERKIDIKIIKEYEINRDFPAINGTSRLSLHLRFGTISIRKLAKIALSTSEKWLNELIWRDFYQMILYQFPHSAINSFKPNYDKIKWRNDEKDFKNWCEGKTGYPIVDAGMRELNQTGFMHNRVRMIAACFLTKHLLIDWRWGEKYFAEKLLDYDMASNVGGWQWAASSGCDAVPYFRIFNPEIQTKKFDPDLKYIKKWIPELETKLYPQMIVDHKMARKLCLDAFDKIKNYN